jgi:hypothetical protein
MGNSIETIICYRKITIKLQFSYKIVTEKLKNDENKTFWDGFGEHMLFSWGIHIFAKYPTNTSDQPLLTKSLKERKI